MTEGREEEEGGRKEGRKEERESQHFTAMREREAAMHEKHNLFFISFISFHCC